MTDGLDSISCVRCPKELQSLKPTSTASSLCSTLDGQTPHRGQSSAGTSTQRCSSRLDVGQLVFAPDSPYMLVRTTDTTVPEGRLFIAPVAALTGTTIDWRPI